MSELNFSCEIEAAALAELGTDKLDYIALQGDSFAMLAGDALGLVSLNGASVRINTVRRLGWKPDVLNISPSQRYLMLARAKDRAVIWDLSEDRPLGEFQGPTIATFAVTGGQELLFRTNARDVLEAYRLPDMVPTLPVDSRRPGSFKFSYLLPTQDDGDTFYALGFHSSDAWDSLLQLSYRELVADAGAADRALRDQRGASDRARTLAVGPCGGGRIVVFRDPDNGEDPGETDVPEAWAFRGILVRSAPDGKIAQRIDVDLPINTGAPICATESAVAAVCPGHVQIISRFGNLPHMNTTDVAAGAVRMARIDGRAFSLDPHRGCVAVARRVGGVQIVDIESMLPKV